MLNGVYKELQDLDSVIFSSIISPYSPSHLKLSFPLYFAQAIAGEILCAFVSSHFFFFAYATLSWILLLGIKGS